MAGNLGINNTFVRNFDGFSSQLYTRFKLPYRGDTVFLTLSQYGAFNALLALDFKSGAFGVRATALTGKPSMMVALYADSTYLYIKKTYSSTNGYDTFMVLSNHANLSYDEVSTLPDDAAAVTIN